MSGSSRIVGVAKQADRRDRIYESVLQGTLPPEQKKSLTGCLKEAVLAQMPGVTEGDPAERLRYRHGRVAGKGKTKGSAEEAVPRMREDVRPHDGRAALTVEAGAGGVGRLRRAHSCRRVAAEARTRAACASRLAGSRA